jgi:hypothetical protein
VSFVTPADVEIGDTFTLTINNKDIQVTATAATVANVVGLFVTAINNSTIPEWMEITASDGTTHLILTGPSDGKPFTVTSSTGDAGNLGVSVAETVAGSAGANEQQRISLPGNVTGGTFTLTFEGQTTGALTYDESAADIDTALELLSTIDSVTVTGSAGGPWTVEFTGEHAEKDVSLLTGNGSSLTKASSEYTVNVGTVREGSAAVNEQQTISLPSGVSGGTFTLTFDDQTTGALTYDESAADIETALEALSNIDAVSVTGNAGGPWVVEFQGQYAGIGVPLLTGNGGSLTGAASITVTEVTTGGPANEIQDVVCPDYVPSFNLEFTNHLGQTDSGGFLRSWSAAQFQNGLEALSSIGEGSASVTLVATGHWRVEFIGELAGVNQSSLSVLSGAPVTITTIQAGSTTGTNEVQRYVVRGATGGTYTLSFRGQTTSALTHDDSVADIDTALEALSTIGAGNVSVAALSDDTGYAYSVTFQGDLANEDVPLLTAATGSLTGGTVYVSTTQTAIAGVNEIQGVTLYGAPAGGTFTLTFDGQTTGALTYDESAADVETALEALSNIDAVTVSGPDGGPWLIVFLGTNAATDVLQMTGDGSSLSGADVSISVVQAAAASVDEVQTISLTGSPTGGTFTLTYSAQTTSAIAYDAPSAVIQDELEGLSNIDPGEALVAGSAGGPWTVLFQGDLGAQDVTAMTGDGGNLTGTGAQTFVVSADTSPTGPHHFDDADNWTGGAVPIDADDIVFEESDVDCLYGLSQATVTPASITIRQSFTGKIGLPVYTGEYYEYRDTYLRIGDPADASTVNITIGEGAGSGSGRIKLDLGGCQTNLLVVDSGTPEGNASSILWKGTHASNVAQIYKGYVGIGELAGESAVLSKLQVGYRSNQSDDATVVCGENVDVTTWEQTGGTVSTDGDSGTDPTITVTAGELTLGGTDGVTQLTIRGGTVYYNCSGTIAGNTVISGDGLLDFSQDMRAKTVTNPIEVYGDEAEVKDPFQVVSSLIVDYNETTRLENLGTNIRLTRGTPA